MSDDLFRAPLGNDPLLRLLQKERLNAHSARTLARIEQEVGEPARPQEGATAAGDTRKLRGIPAVGPGVGGTMDGTDPVRELLKKEREQSRYSDRGDVS